MLPPQTKRSRRMSPTGKKKDPKTGQKGWMPFCVEDKNLKVEVHHIDGRGDLILKIENAVPGKDLHYLVSIKTLQAASPYFNLLLDTTKFAEGVGLGEKLAELERTQGTADWVPLSMLPIITIKDVGAVPKTATIEVVLALFFCILHMKSWEIEWGQPEWPFLALLAIIADRFNALPIITGFVHEQAWAPRSFTWDEKKALDAKEETKVRQQILAGLLLGIHQLLKKQTAVLTVAGSMRWSGGHEGEEAQLAKVDTDVLWWDLPQNLEDEMSTRRLNLLQTLSSLQKQIFNLYIDKPNQCRLGYDTSPACNMFQLGQATRFFVQKGMTTMESGFIRESETGMMIGNTLDVITTLRACPERQIDSNHQHCGVRSKLIAGLDLIVPLVQVGICGECWKQDSHAESWDRSPCGDKWLYAAPGRALTGCEVHRRAKEMYTAKERDWMYRPT